MAEQFLASFVQCTAIAKNLQSLIGWALEIQSYVDTKEVSSFFKGFLAGFIEK